jgi:hypothetical protein
VTRSEVLSHGGAERADTSPFAPPLALPQPLGHPFASVGDREPVFFAPALPRIVNHYTFTRRVTDLQSASHFTFGADNCSVR